MTSAMTSTLRFTKKVLEATTPMVISARGSVVEKCSTAVPRALKKFKKLQEHYQNEENKKPIYLKGGLKDQILYRLTVLLCMVGVGLQGYHYYHMVKPSS